jgi:hypothetical protein
VSLQPHLRLKNEFAIRTPEATLLAELMLQAQGDGAISATLRTLGAALGCAHSRVSVLGERLAARGLVEIEHPRTGNGFNAPTIYRFAKAVLEVARQWQREARLVHHGWTVTPVHHGCKQERSLKTESNPSNSESEKTAGFDLAKNQGGLERCAPMPAPRPVARLAPPEPSPPATCGLKDLKRRNLIKGIRSTLPTLPGFAGNWEAQIAADALLRRTEAAIADWKSRPPEDRTVFEKLVALTRTYRPAAAGPHDRRLATAFHQRG